MSADAAPELPDVASVLAPLLQRVPRREQPLLVAIAERMAADRYRGWAKLAAEPAERAQLLACAEREEEIARRIEGLTPDADAVQRELRARHPDLAELNQGLFEGRPIREQLRIQANGERLGAATWRSFARHSDEPGTRETFLECAELEEASARVLEAILDGRA